MTSTKISVEVAFATPKKQLIVPLQVDEGTTAKQAAIQSNIVEHFPEIDLDNSKMGIFGQALGVRGVAEPDSYQMQAGDRLEIYRPLIADPKEVRKQRAKSKKMKNEK